MIIFCQNEILYYMIQDRYITRKFYPVCINLEMQHLGFLKQIAQTNYEGDYSLAIYYLLNKYLNYLYHIRITPRKKTETANYQPQTKRYKKKTISMNPVLWSKLFEMRHFVGYSISALIRIMLDWEMQSLGYDIIPWIPLPDLIHDNTRNSEMQLIAHWINNYFYKKQGFYESRRIIAIFVDQYS